MKKFIENNWELGFFFLIFICPAIIYFSIIKLGLNYGIWIIAIMWWIILWMYHDDKEEIKNLKNKISEREDLIKNIETTLSISRQLKNKINGKIRVQKNKLFEKAEKNNTTESWDNLADYDEKWDADVEKDELLLENLEETIKQIKNQTK